MVDNSQGHGFYALMHIWPRIWTLTLTAYELSSRSPLIPRSAMQLIAVQSAFWICSQIFRNKNPLCMRPLKLLVISASCSLNITVSSTLLSSFGEQWRNISANTVTTLTLVSKNIFLMSWPQLMNLLFRSGSIGWYDVYWEGKGTKEAQIQVKKFGSCKQSSHRRVYESVSIWLD